MIKYTSDMRSTHSLLAIASHFEYGGVAQLGARCTQKRTHIEQLKKLGAFAGMADTSQITLF